MEGRSQRLRDHFEIQESVDEGKICSIQDAIRKHVRDGMAIFMPQLHNRYCGAIYEIARQFWGKNPHFTLISISINMPTSILVHGGLVDKLITGYCGDMYYSPGPNKIFQRAYMSKQVIFENWSLLTLAQRLKAGAQGISFFPTYSLLGSSLIDNNRYCKVIKDPFDSSQEICLVQALNPDISIVHGLAADSYGNTIFVPPYMENLYGVMGNREGAIVSVEKIVPTSFIRKYSQFVRLPGQYVKSVSEMPFGAHPYGMACLDVPEIDGYAEDYEFVNSAKKAGEDLSTLESWIEEWVLSIENHENYLRKLGSERLLHLKGKARPDGWKWNFEESLIKIASVTEYNTTEFAIIAAARKLAQIVKKKKYKTILCGGGISNLVGWMANYLLGNEDINHDLAAENGIFGYEPRPTDPAIFNHRNFPTCKMLTDTFDILGILAGGKNNRCVGSLGAAEIDKHGNINTTMVPEKYYIGGSGGANDIASCASEMLVTALQSLKRFLDKVHYVTSPGKNVRTLVSNMGVFEKVDEGDELKLSGYFANSGNSSEEDVIRSIISNCGWKLDVLPNPEKIEEPKIEELRILRLMDPDRHFLGK